LRGGIDKPRTYKKRRKEVMIKLKAGDLRNIGSGVMEILKIELPVKPSYWLARIATKIDSELKAFETARMNLIKKHAKKDKKGNPLVIKDKDGKPTNNFDVPDIEAFNKEFKELTEQEFEINVDPIKLDALGDIKIKPVILAKLEKIIVV